MTNPIFDYSRSGGCAAITGGAFVPRGVWPAEFDGQYLFGDYVCGRIFRLSRNADGTYSQSTFASGLGGSSAVAMMFGPWEATQALYYTTYAGGGQVRRITSTVNRAPTATLTASPTSGPAPLTVRFDASGSSDPDGQTLSFEWDFGDGIMAPNGSVQTHTYQNAGRFTARVTVRDGAGGTAAPMRRLTGGTPLQSHHQQSQSSPKFSSGRLHAQRQAADAETGPFRLPPTWAVHCTQHAHASVVPPRRAKTSPPAPAPEDLAATATSHLSIQLTATDSNGAMSTVTRTLRPNLVNVTLDSVPSGLTLSVNGTTVSTPRTITSWDKYVLTLGAATQRDTNATPWLFSTWSTVERQALMTTRRQRPRSLRRSAATAASPSADAYVRAGASASQSFGTAAELVVKQSTSADYQRRTHLRFPIGSGPVGRALLRLRGALSASGNMPVSVYRVSNITWSEGTVTWNTQPPAGATAIASNRVASTSSAGTNGTSRPTCKRKRRTNERVVRACSNGGDGSRSPLRRGGFLQPSGAAFIEASSPAPSLAKSCSTRGRAAISGHGAWSRTNGGRRSRIFHRFRCAQVSAALHTATASSFVTAAAGRRTACGSAEGGPQLLETFRS